MSDSYATVAELETWLDGAAPANADVLLERASEFIDSVAFGTFEIDSVTQLPTDSDVVAAMRKAVCAQVQFWLAVGEDIDIEGAAGRQVSVGGLSMALPERLPPRAEDALRSQNLLRST